MRLDGGVSHVGVKDASEILPKHFTGSYSSLVEFLQYYIDMLYKTELTTNQVQSFMEDETWWSRKDDVFGSSEERLYNKVKDFQQFRKNFGVADQTTNMIDDKNLQRQAFRLETLDGYLLSTSDDRSVGVVKRNDFHEEAWLKDKGFSNPSLFKDSEVKADPATIVKLARHLYKIRGSAECARIFFEALYGGKVYVTFPRESISRLDDNFTLDGVNKLRDDIEYDEFTYVINLVASKYEKIGDKFFQLWNQRFHPGGFRCILRVYTEYEWLITSDNLTDLPNYVTVWKQFFEGTFSETMHRLDQWSI